jgi:non-ribosomal peptide synthetase component F
MASPVDVFLPRRARMHALRIRAFALALLASLVATACGGSDIRTDDPQSGVENPDTPPLCNDTANPVAVKSEQARPGQGGTR